MTSRVLSWRPFAKVHLLLPLKNSDFASVSHLSTVLPIAGTVNSKTIHFTSLVLVSKISRYAKKFSHQLMGAQSFRDMRHDFTVISRFTCNLCNGTRTNIPSSVRWASICIASCFWRHQQLHSCLITTCKPKSCSLTCQLWSKHCSRAKLLKIPLTTSTSRRSDSTLQLVRKSPNAMWSLVSMYHC